MSGYSGMISFELNGGLDAARSFSSSTRVFTLAESLGGVESLQLERAQGGDLSQEDTRQGDRCGGQCRFRRAECGCVVGILGKILLEHPADRIEADGTNDEKFVGDGGQDG